MKVGLKQDCCSMLPSSQLTLGLDAARTTVHGQTMRVGKEIGMGRDDNA